MPNKKPNSEEAVFIIMQEYSTKKGYSFSDTQLRFMAENCYLYFESRGWGGIKYWPAVAMKWCLNEKGSYAKRNEGKYDKKTITYKKPKPHGQSIRDRILEDEYEN